MKANGGVWMIWYFQLSPHSFHCSQNWSVSADGGYTRKTHDLAGCTQVSSQERVLPLTSASGGCCLLEDVLRTLQTDLSHEQWPFLECQCHMIRQLTTGIPWRKHRSSAASTTLGDSCWFASCRTHAAQQCFRAKSCLAVHANKETIA